MLSMETSHLVLKQSNNMHFYQVNIFIKHDLLSEYEHFPHGSFKIYRVSDTFYVCRALRCEKVVLRETPHNSGSPY